MALHADEALAAARSGYGDCSPPPIRWPRQTSPQSSSWLLISASSLPAGASMRPGAHAAGDEVRTVIAGYHWFNDWAAIP